MPSKNFWNHVGKMMTAANQATSQEWPYTASGCPQDSPQAHWAASLIPPAPAKPAKASQKHPNPRRSSKPRSPIIRACELLRRIDKQPDGLPTPDQCPVLRQLRDEIRALTEYRRPHPDWRHHDAYS